MVLFAFALDSDRTLLHQRRARAVLGRGAARGAARGRPLVRGRGGEPRARRAAALRPRRRLDLPGQGGGDRGRAVPARSRARASPSSCSTTSRCASGRDPRAARPWPRPSDLAATGTVYGVLAGGLRARETLVPLLVLPAVTPVMLGATRAFASRARRRARRRVAVGAAARRVRGARRRARASSRSDRCWRKHDPEAAASSSRRSSRSRSTLVFALVGHAAASRTRASTPCGCCTSTFPSRVARVPRVRRHRARVGAVAHPADARRRRGTCSPARRPRSASCSPGSRSSSARSGASRRGAPGGSGTRASPRTAILFFLYLGYLALRRTGATADERGKRCAIAALIAFADVPIVLLLGHVVADAAPDGHRVQPTGSR